MKRMIEIDDDDLDANGVIKDGKHIRVPLMMKDGKPVTQDGRTLDEEAWAIAQRTLNGVAPVTQDAAAKAMEDQTQAALARQDHARDKWMEKLSRKGKAA